MIFWNTIWNTPYQLEKSFNGWRLVSRFKISSTGEHHYLFNYKHNMSRCELQKYIKTQRTDFIIMDDFRFDMLEELVSD